MLSPENLLSLMDWEKERKHRTSWGRTVLPIPFPLWYQPFDWNVLCDFTHCFNHCFVRFSIFLQRICPWSVGGGVGLVWSPMGRKYQQGKCVEYYFKILKEQNTSLHELFADISY